ncbi:MAG TPA: hypothetical protein DCK79_03795 [Candidatus Atribacteria bacterium]|nr:hypothetical protein [Candidatus Atribacteria bacterium]
MQHSRTKKYSFFSNIFSLNYPEYHETIILQGFQAKKYFFQMSKKKLDKYFCRVYPDSRKKEK